MSTSGPFDTGYLGAHRWHCEDRRGYDWTCVCGDKGRVVGNLAFLYEAFGRHALEKLQEAAVALLLQPLPHTSVVQRNLEARARLAQEAGDMDKQNILMSAANLRHHEAQESLRQDYEALRWTSWPEATSEGRAVEVEAGYDSYWLHVHPSQTIEGVWVWETWLVDPRSGDETKLSQGGMPTLADAQRASWDALVTQRNEREAEIEEPF